MTRKPSLLWFAALFLAGSGGLVLMATVSVAFLIGVVGGSAAIVALSLRRWPPEEWLARPKQVRLTRPPIGGLVATLGTVFSFFGAIMLAAAFTEPHVLVMALLMIVMLAVWLRLAFVYAGR